MTWAIEWTDRARRDLRRLDRQMAERAITAMERLAATEQGDVTRLQGVESPEWRLRVGDWRIRFQLLRFRQHADLNDAVFQSRSGGGHLHPSMIERIVTKAAARAGVEGKVSPHWLRHSHATHALEGGAAIHLALAKNHRSDSADWAPGPAA